MVRGIPKRADDYEQFRRVNEKLMTTKGGNWFKRAPFRVYVVDEKTAEDPYALVDIIEQPFPIIKEDGAPQTLRDLQHSLGLHAGAGQWVVVRGRARASTARCIPRFRCARRAAPGRNLTCACSR